MIDSYKVVISEISKKDYEVPERYIVYQFVVEDIVNLKNLEDYNYLFSKYYKLHFSGKYNDILFTKIISTYKFYYRFDSRISESFEKARENQHQLKRKLVENFYLMKNLIHKMINNPSNELIMKELVELYMYQNSKEFNSYDSKFVIDNYILNAMEIVSGGKTKDFNINFTPSEYKDVYDVYESTLNVFERLKENVKNNFLEINNTIGSLEDALENIKELSTELKFICQNMATPTNGGFSNKLKKYLEIE